MSLADIRDRTAATLLRIERLQRSLSLQAAPRSTRVTAGVGGGTPQVPEGQSLTAWLATAHDHDNEGE